MKFLEDLPVNAKFRVAYPQQRSLNGKDMPQDRVFRITKIFQQSPYFRVCRMVNGPSQTVYTLSPNTVVLDTSVSVYPTRDEVLRFLSPATPTKKVVGFRLLWDGKSTLEGVCNHQERGLLEMMYTFNRGVYGKIELMRLADENSARFFPKSRRLPSAILATSRRRLVAFGLIEEIIEEIPSENLSDAGVL